MVEDPASLRRRLRARRRDLAAEVQRHAAEAVARTVARWAAARRWATVLAYADHAGEVGTGPTIAALADAGVAVGLPRVEDEQLHFHRVGPATGLEPGPFGIPMPPADAPPVPGPTVQAALVPLVAFDEQGSRLGMGGGFYDRFLAQHSHIERIGLAHDAQRVSRLRRRPWDQRLDVIVTPTMVVRPPPR